MLMSPIVLVIWLAILATSAFAFWKGGAPERVGAGLLLFVAIFVLVINTFLPISSRAVPRLASDGVMALGLLVLVVVYASLWLGAAMLLQAVQFSLHAYYFVVSKPMDLTYYVVNNLVTVGVVLCLLIGTVIHWHRERGMVSI